VTEDFRTAQQTLAGHERREAEPAQARMYADSGGASDTPRPRRFRAQWQSRALRVILPACICIALTAWAFAGLNTSGPVAPRGAPLVLTAITFGLAVVVRRLCTHFEVYGRARLTLPDPLYTSYLAALILTGIHVAVALAVLTPVVENLPEVVRRTPRVGPVLRQSAAAGVTTLTAGITFTALDAAFKSHSSVLEARVLAAIGACVVIFVGSGVERALELGHIDSLTALAQTFTTQTMRFQILLLSVGPLLPLAELLDDVEAEFAWVLFLVPLGAMYYLALVSTRLHQRGEELQNTIVALQQSRRRQAELSDYAALITRAQEAERRRLARELHDDTAQALIALARGIDALAPRQTDSLRSSYDAHFIAELGDLAKRTLESVRRACQDLRPPVLDDLGLPAALDSLAQSVSRRGLPTTFRQSGAPTRLAPEQDLTIYRIAQEALANAHQHADASTASLELAYRPHAIGLCVRDDGKGFDHDAVVGQHVEGDGAEELRPGLGLLGMRERAALVGAQLDVVTAPGVGTTISLHVPVRD
jgi:signal transduction histidine kinase